MHSHILIQLSSLRTLCSQDAGGLLVLYYHILNISYTSATGTGSYNIGGLPFTSANIDQNYAVGSILPSGVNWTGGTSLVALQFQNTNYIVPYYMSDDGSADSQQMVNESANFRLSLTYYTS